MYPDSVEDLPPDIPPHRGNHVEVNFFVDSYRSGYKVTRRSQTGILLYLNSAPIIWYSKSQNTAESSTFGYEFIALRLASELIISLKYKFANVRYPIISPLNVIM